MILPLQLRHGDVPEADSEAWFLPGDSVVRWLDQLVASGLATQDAKLFPVPRSAGDRTPAGLLVVPARQHRGFRVSSGMACRLVAGRMFLPFDAILHPPVSDSELVALCRFPVGFFHPVFGLSGFEGDSALRVSDLLKAPGLREGPWNAARAGAPGLPKLSAVVLRAPPSVDDVFGGAQEEIASKSPWDLPPAPDEPKENLIPKVARNLRRIFLEGVSRAMRSVPHTGSHRTRINDAEDWASRGLRGVNDELERLRKKELNRLLHMLDTDPDSGLRHAIPLSAFAHRGIAPPGSRLGPRSLNFDPNRLGGGPADFWNLGSDVQETLRRRYREMADREMQLGRHRRAAYIYAQLLGDLVSAAGAFKQGGLFREAAVLYEDQLKNPVEAANCLAEGGFLTEAIERFEKLGRWLDVANLQKRAGNLPAAELAIRRVVDERLAQGDLLTAARMLEEHLQASDEALVMLLGAWPASRQAASCVGAAFQLLAKLGRHEVTRDRIAEFSREPVPHALALPLICTLAGVARDYPHENVRHGAADLARVLIARQLGRSSPPLDEAGRLLEHLMRLAPDDRLLSRDANRFLADHRRVELNRRARAIPPVPGEKPVLHRSFELPRQFLWLELRREWHWFYALGVTPKQVILVRGVWEGEVQSLTWTYPTEAARHRVVVEPMADQGREIALAFSGGPPFPRKQFPSTDLFFSTKCFAGTPSWLPTQSFPFAMGEDAVWAVHVANQRAVLTCHEKLRGSILRTIDVTDDLLDGAESGKDAGLSLAVFASGVAVALGNRLVLTRGDGTRARVELPGQATRLFTSIPNTRQGVAVMLQRGAVLCWVGSESCMELDRDIQSPIGTFVPGGPLVLVSGFEATLLEADSRGVKTVARLTLTGQRPVGVSATANPGEFAILGERGEITLFRMPR